MHLQAFGHCSRCKSKASLSCYWCSTAQLTCKAWATAAHCS